MAVKDIGAYRERKGLVETTDPEFERPLWRKPGFDEVIALEHMDKAISDFLREARHREALTREQLAELLGISGQVYGRYERAFSKLNVTRLVHLSEILGFKPIELIYAAAPHLFGETSAEAQDRIALIRLMSRMKPEAVKSLLMLVGELSGGADEPS